MKTPLELTFVNMDNSEFVEKAVRERVARLEKLHDGITSCHVSVGAPHQSKQHGKRYEVRIELRVPGTELAVSDNPGDVNAHEDMYVALRDAFDAMERQLQKWKRHEDPRYGA